MGARERFISSIEYLRKLGFFEEHSNMTSEEVFEKISEGSILLRDLDKKEEEWAKESDFEIDVFMAMNDKKRIWKGFDYDELPNLGVGLKYLNGLANISRGAFQPANMREKCNLEKDEYGLDVGYCKVYFTYNGKERILEFPWSEVHRWQFGHAMNELNRMIRHKGYKYYRIRNPDMYLFVVLKLEEAKKLRRERGWKLEDVIWRL